MSPFYFKILYKTPEKEMYVFRLIANGEIYFKACDLGHLLGYRNVSNVLGCHMETKKTIDHLLKNPRLKCPIPRRSRIVELSQVPSLLNRMTRPPNRWKIGSKRCKLANCKPDRIWRTF
ncbi:hypothetical protein TNIN_314611 [Trichonephila inaurata madagascariensis]|uniref:Uncharacterized protein n=1 Tax=Trichonephila inaurata madagascariensis TaxID=2747483 RepID=A0A8X6Y0X9_9ARAC|nr:hypothetical protein TNIN_314611 [Trichonephila inaurata madagascariensis]